VGAAIPGGGESLGRADLLSIGFGLLTSSIIVGPWRYGVFASGDAPPRDFPGPVFTVRLLTSFEGSFTGAVGVSSVCFTFIGGVCFAIRSLSSCFFEGDSCSGCSRFSGGGLVLDFFFDFPVSSDRSVLVFASGGGFGFDRAFALAFARFTFAFPLGLGVGLGCGFG